jgi:hypothetical protein
MTRRKGEITSHTNERDFSTEAARERTQAITEE